MAKGKSDGIKSVKSVVDDRLKDGNFDYGAEQSFGKISEQVTEVLPRRSNAFKTGLITDVMNCLPRDGMCKENEVEGLAKRVYDTAYSNVVENIYGYKGRQDIPEKAREEVDDTVKAYLGNLDEKTLKRGFEDQLKQTGYIDPDHDLIKNNILRYPVNTFVKKRQKRLFDELEGMLESQEKFDKFKSYIKHLGTQVNKTVEDEEIWMPSKATDTWFKLENVRKSLQKM